MCSISFLYLIYVIVDRKEIDQIFSWHLGPSGVWLWKKNRPQILYSERVNSLFTLIVSANQSTEFVTDFDHDEYVFLAQSQQPQPYDFTLCQDCFWNEILEMYWNEKKKYWSDINIFFLILSRKRMKSYRSNGIYKSYGHIWWPGGSER